MDNNKLLPPSQKALEAADAFCSEGVLLSGALVEPERNEIARIIDKAWAADNGQS